MSLEIIEQILEMQNYSGKQDASSKTSSVHGSVELFYEISLRNSLKYFC
jgi:hypothetical protein